MLERSSLRWLLAAPLLLCAALTHAQTSDTGPHAEVPAVEAAPAPEAAGAAPAGQDAEAAAPAGQDAEAAAPAGTASESASSAAPAAEPAAVEAAPAVAPAQAAVPQVAVAPAAASPAASTEASPGYSDGYTEEYSAGYEAGRREATDEAEEKDPMDSGLALRAGVEFQGARKFGSVTRQVLGSDLIKDGITQQTGVTIDPNAYIETPEDFRIAPSADLQLAAGLNLGGFIFYRLEGIATFGSLTTLSAYNGLGFNLHFGQVYVGAGIGGRVGYMMHSQLDWGASVAGRVPVDVTVYVAPDIAFFLEGGAAWGIDIVQVTGVQDVATANTTTFDLSAGFRFP